MAAFSLSATKITGTGSAFPKKVLNNHELTKILASKGQETSNEWILERTGIFERRISEDGNEDETNSSLCLKAATAALEMAGKKAADIDLIICGTCTPDRLCPSNACYLQAKLGATNAWAFDLNAACSGFVYSVATADQFIKTGSCKTILVTGSDVLHAFTDWDDRTTCVLFGDAAGAVILERVPADHPHRILSSHLLSDGRLTELFHIYAGGSSRPVDERAIEERAHKMRMKGREVFKEATRTLAEFALKALKHNGLDATQIDWLIPHQANLRIIEAVARRLDFPMEKVLVNIDRYGNTSSGTVPTALDEAVRDGRIKPGHLVLMDVFGAGLTYGSLLVRW